MIWLLLPAPVLLASLSLPMGFSYTWTASSSLNTECTRNFMPLHLVFQLLRIFSPFSTWQTPIHTLKSISDQSLPLESAISLFLAHFCIRLCRVRLFCSSLCTQTGPAHGKYFVSISWMVTSLFIPHMHLECPLCAEHRASFLGFYINRAQTLLIVQWGSQREADNITMTMIYWQLFHLFSFFLFSLNWP